MDVSAKYALVKPLKNKNVLNVLTVLNTFM